MLQKTILRFDKWDYKKIKVSIQPRKQSSETAYKMRKNTCQLYIRPEVSVYNASMITAKQKNLIIRWSNELKKHKWPMNIKDV